MKKLLFGALLGLGMTSFGQNTTTEYSARVLSTNFNVPIIRFNLVKNPIDRTGNVAFFNSVGAGVGYYFGRITEVKDKEGRMISSEMDNTFGANFGILFASNSAGGTNENIFAPVLGFSVLNFQLGVGYELGTLPAGNERTFMTLTYAIPAFKLIKGGFWVLKKEGLDASAKQRGFMKF